MKICTKPRPKNAKKSTFGGGCLNRKRHAVFKRTDKILVSFAAVFMLVAQRSSRCVTSLKTAAKETNKIYHCK